MRHAIFGINLHIKTNLEAWRFTNSSPQTVSVGSNVPCPGSKKAPSRPARLLGTLNGTTTGTTAGIGGIRDEFFLFETVTLPMYAICCATATYLP